MPSGRRTLPIPLLVLPLVACLVACAFPVSDEAEALRMDVASVDLDPANGSPVLLLREREGLRRELPIWIGEFEALSIALATENIPSPRPNSHDLIKDMLEQVDGRISRVVITELRNNTYYAVIELAVGGRTLKIDSRPSDAIAIAIRAGTPIFTTPEILGHTDGIPTVDDAVDVDWNHDGVTRDLRPSDA